MTDLFDYVKSINNKSGELEVDSEYKPFLVNRAFSYFMDTIFHANEVNKFTDVPPEFQYLFFYHGVRKGKRFSKWYKPEKDKYIDIIKECFGYSNEKAKAVLDLFNQEQLEELKQSIDKGGKK